MRWFASLVLTLALGVAGCGDWMRLDDPCGDCGDGNPCTRDYCTVEGCAHSPLEDGAACGGDNVCVRGVCTEDVCVDCEDDGDPCTLDCDYTTGCDYEQLPEGYPCGDEAACVSGVCLSW